MVKLLVAYAVAGAVFLVLDIVWLGYLAKGFYEGAIGPLLADKVNLKAAMAFYVLFLTGLVFFCIVPALETGGVMRALLWGAAFGCVTYGTYDLTCLAILKCFPVSMAIVDMAWGTFLAAVAAAAGAAAAQSI